MSYLVRSNLVPTGLDWQPLAPKGWKKAALKHLGQFDNGYAFKPEDWGASGRPIVRIAQLTGGEFDNRYAGELDEDLLVSAGDLLFSWSATIDSFIWEREDGWLNQHIFKVTPSDESDKKFLYYLIKHIAPKFADVDAHGSTMRHIKKESLSQRVVVPDVAEQRRIAAFLDGECEKAGALIRRQRRMLDLLQERRVATTEQEIFGRGGGGALKDSAVEWIGSIPAHWDVRRLGSIFEEVSEDGDDSLPILSVSIHTGVSDKELDEVDSDRQFARSEDKSKYRRVAPGDLVYNMMRAWQGAFGTVAVPGMVSPAYVVARPTHAIQTEFFERVLRSPRAVDEVTRHSRGVTDFRLRLYWEEFKDIRVPVPPVEEQLAILERLRAEDRAAERLRTKVLKAIDVAEERLSVLISDAVTGRIEPTQVAAATVSEEMVDA